MNISDTDCLSKQYHNEFLKKYKEVSIPPNENGAFIICFGKAKRHSNLPETDSKVAEIQDEISNMDKDLKSKLQNHVFHFQSYVNCIHNPSYTE